MEPVPPPSPPRGGGLGLQRSIGVGLAVGGVVSAAVGAVLGLAAKSTQDSAFSSGCRDGNPNDCSIQGVDNSHLAYSEAAASTAAFVAAGALLVGGAVVYFTAARPDHATVGLALGDRSIGLRGTW